MRPTGAPDEREARGRGHGRGRPGIPVSEFGPAWPQGVPVQVHGLEADPLFAGDRDAADRLVAESADAELFLYPGDQHLFADSSLPAHDPEAAALLNRRALDFLAAHGESGLRSR